MQVIDHLDRLQHGLRGRDAHARPSAASSALRSRQTGQTVRFVLSLRSVALAASKQTFVVTILPQRGCRRDSRAVRMPAETLARSGMIHGHKRTAPCGDGLAGRRSGRIHDSLAR